MKLGLFDKLYNKILTWLTRERPPRELPLSDFERIRYEVRPCDVILIEGRSHVSDLIRQVTQSPWSHAALYIGRLHDIEDPALREIVAEYYPDADPSEQLIIQSLLGQGTIVSTLSMYKNDHIRICRPKGISQKDAQRVIEYAVNRLGADYNVRHVFDLLRFMLPWSILPKRWRSSLFSTHPNHTTRVICSSLIAEGFKFVQFPILPMMHMHEEKGLELVPRNPRLYTPGDFDYSPYFEIIKYPFLEVSEHTHYRRLPWAEDEMISDDEGKLYDHEPTAETSQKSDDDKTNETNETNETNDTDDPEHVTPSPDTTEDNKLEDQDKKDKNES